MLRLPTALALAALLAAAPARAADPEDAAREINWTSAAATAVIAGLQDKINGGTATPADLDAAALSAAYAAAYQRLANRSLQAGGEGPVAEIRSFMARAKAEVLEAHRDDILRGGQDAFVPAFFRAQLFDRFNAAAEGRYRAVATNRRAELINSDSGVERLITDPEIVALVTGLMQRGTMQAETRVMGPRTVGYWPMTITQPCMVCHQRNGLQQQVGQFGGATVVIVGR